MHNKSIFKLFLITLLLSTINLSFAENEEHSHEDENIPKYYLGEEAFETVGTYELVLKKSAAEAEIARLDVQALRKQFSNITNRSKSTEQKNDIYFELTRLLPAGTVFRITSAHDIDDGNTEVTIETNSYLDKEQVLLEDQIMSFTDGPVWGYVNPIYPEPDESTKSLPDNWNKETGYQEIIKTLASGAEVVKVSVVFNNPSNNTIKAYEKPYYKIITSLRNNKKGYSYGLGHNQNQLAWWTQDIYLEQAIELYENEQVVNLVPRD